MWLRTGTGLVSRKIMRLGNKSSFLSFLLRYLVVISGPPPIAQPEFLFFERVTDGGGLQKRHNKGLIAKFWQTNDLVPISLGCPWARLFFSTILSMLLDNN